MASTVVTVFDTPSRRILGVGHPCVRGGSPRLVELGLTPEEELRRDRRALGKLAVGTLAAGVIGAGILRKGRGPTVTKRTPALLKKPLEAPAKALRKRLPGDPLRPVPVKGRVKAARFEEKRDKLSRARDVVEIGGTLAGAAGTIGVVHGIRKVAKKAENSIGYAGGSIARAAREVRREVTPERVAREGLKLVKKKAKQKAVEYFPTFTKAARALKKQVFATPAGRLGVIEFREREQLRNEKTDVFSNPLRVTAGVERAYRPGLGKTKIPEDLPIGNAQVIRAAHRKAGELNKWGTRGGRLAKDAVNVVRGKGRERDASGRKKKREWEKGWFQDAAKKVAITGGVLAEDSPEGVGLRAVGGLGYGRRKSAETGLGTLAAPEGRAARGRPALDLLEPGRVLAHRSWLLGHPAGPGWASLRPPRSGLQLSGSGRPWIGERNRSEAEIARVAARFQFI